MDFFENRFLMKIKARKICLGTLGTLVFSDDRYFILLVIFFLISEVPTVSARSRIRKIKETFKGHPVEKSESIIRYSMKN